MKEGIIIIIALAGCIIALWLIALRGTDEPKYTAAECIAAYKYAGQEGSK